MLLVPIPQISSSGTRGGSDSSTLSATRQSADGSTARGAYTHALRCSHVPFVPDVPRIGRGVVVVALN